MEGIPFSEPNWSSLTSQPQRPMREPSQLSNISGSCRKRRNVPDEERKRVVKACNACRKLKEKCEGGVPCVKCTRLGRKCEIGSAPKDIEPRNVASSPRLDEDRLDLERVKALETIARHYTGHKNPSTAILIQIANRLVAEQIASNEQQLNSRDGSSTEPQTGVNGVGEENGEEDDEFAVEPISSTTASYTGELSHCQFSTNVQKRLQQNLHGSDIEHSQEIFATSALTVTSRFYTGPATVSIAAAAFPPQNIASFLLDVFFDYAQTNYSYLDEPSLRQKLEFFYTRRQSLESSDASWLCTSLAMFAVATQFAHLSGGKGQYCPLIANNINGEESTSSDDNVAMTFYQAAIPLLPDIIAIASVESVQAFLMLGVFTLPIDASGLSYVYFGIAIKMAIGNGMHRNVRRGIDARTIELRKRIWWTAYTVERRICALHGRPVSIARSEVDVEEPSDCSIIRSPQQIDNLPNIQAMIRLTKYLEDAKSRISSIRKSPSRSRATIFQSVLLLKQELNDYWLSLPCTIYCTDLTPSGPLFRPNIHLALTYHLVHIFIGRAFMFGFPHTSSGNTVEDGPTSISPQMKMSLISSCLDSALRVIELCQTLESEVGLARASYTEFSTCKSAFLVILAQRIQERGNQRLISASKQGVKLLKHMSRSFFVASTEKSAVQSMERAIWRLDDTEQSKIVDPLHPTGSTYDQFRNWAALWRNDTTHGNTPSDQFTMAAFADIITATDSFDLSNFPPWDDIDWSFEPSESQLDTATTANADTNIV